MVNSRSPCGGFPDYHLVDGRGILCCADAANADVEAAIEQLLAETP